MLECIHDGRLAAYMHVCMYVRLNAFIACLNGLIMEDLLSVCVPCIAACIHAMPCIAANKKYPHSLATYIYTCIHTCCNALAHSFWLIPTSLCMNVWMYNCDCMALYGWMNHEWKVWMYVSVVYVYMYICIYVSMCACMYIVQQRRHLKPGYRWDALRNDSFVCSFLVISMQSRKVESELHKDKHRLCRDGTQIVFCWDQEMPRIIVEVAPCKMCCLVIQSTHATSFAESLMRNFVSHLLLTLHTRLKEYP